MSLFFKLGILQKVIVNQADPLLFLYFCISLDLIKSSEVRKAGDQPIYDPDRIQAEITKANVRIFELGNF